jgi:hypothetical protein
VISFKDLWGIRHTWTRHDLILCIGGFIYVLLGLVYVMEDPTPNREIALQALIRVAPMDFWGSIFIFAGVLSLISSRWPRLVESWGYVVLTGISLAWGTAYLTGIVFSNAPWANASGFLLWSLQGSLWWAVSGLRNPEPLGVINGARAG